MNCRRYFVVFAVLLALGQQLHAQVRVEMSMKRRLYLVYEPIIVTVSITNLSGHDLTLDDADSQKWFSFQVTAGDGRIVPPSDLDYHLDPLRIPMGETVKRSLNLTTLYAVQEFGLYRVKASVYSSETQKYYSSASTDLEITDGKLIWEQTVGVPGQKGNRTISLLTFRMEKDNMLYIRVQDKDAGLVYTTNQLGRVLLTYEPEVQLDRENQIHVLQLVGPRTYVYSRIGLNGEWLGQLVYNVVTTRPTFKKTKDGGVTIIGGQPDVPVAPDTPSEPKLSDRPPGFPKS